MTAQEIADRLVDGGRPVTPTRMRKLEKLCRRSDVALEDVLALAKVQQAVEAYSNAQQEKA